MSETPSSRAVIPPKASSPRRRGRSGLFNLLLIVGIVAAVGLFAWAEAQRRTTESRLQQTEAELENAKKSTQAGGEEVANQVLEKLRKHIDIPAEPKPTVATITDSEKLKATNEFYASAKNGDHLIITGKRAILYDPKRDIILDVVPVSLSPTTTPAPAGAGAPPAAAPVTSTAPAVAPPAAASPAP